MMPDQIFLSPQACDDDGLLPLLHFLLELALWRRLTGDKLPAGAQLLAAAHATACLPMLLAQAEAESHWSKPSSCLERLMQEATSTLPSPALLTILSRAWFMLVEDETSPPMGDTWAAFERVRPMAVPVAGLMLRDSDSRIDLFRHSGCNRYGSGALPRIGGIALSSSTANTVSPQGLCRAEALRRRFLAAAAAGRLSDGMSNAASAIRHGILSEFDLLPMAGVEAVLASSGTTATLLATQLATSPGGATLALILGPEESGSGIPLAAGGRHPAPRTPRGTEVIEGSPVEGMAVKDLSVEGMAFRDEGGHPLAPATMEDRINDRVAAAQAQGQRVVLHVLEGSKTGLTTPGTNVVANLLRRFPHDLTIIADCCQMRNGRDVLRRYLEMGCLVVTTGSKFFAGPAFCGVLLLPRSQKVSRLPRGLGAYSWRSDWPQRWSEAWGELPEGGNPGLLLRWRAALGEIRSFNRLTATAVAEALNDIAQTVENVVAGADGVVLLPDESPTIATIALATADGAGWLDRKALQRIYELLGEDLTAEVGQNAPAIAATLCTIGQPVALSDGPIAAGLRLAFSSRHVTMLARSAGSERARRLATLAGDIRTVLDKISLIRRLYPAA